MLLKKYILKSPISGTTEEVYEYPEYLASPIIKRSDCVLISRVPLQIPILVTPKVYLTQIHNEGVLLDMPYADMSLLEHYFTDEKTRNKRETLDDQINKIKEIFSVGTFHKRSCKTIFFTGPKIVYKQTFTDNWVWLDMGVLSLTNRGSYRTIESLSLKDINEVFIAGTFECGGEVVENTQCKIIMSNT